MNFEYNSIWQLALPFLKMGVRKDFELHTKGVIKAVQLILKEERGAPSVLFPAAILHDVGWSSVPIDIQLSRECNLRKVANTMHLDNCVPIIYNILSKLNYDIELIDNIADVCYSHKSTNPETLDKKILIDADALSDIFKEQFYSDCKSYKLNPNSLIKIRSENKFYTRTANIIFSNKYKARKLEIFTQSNDL